MQDYVHVTDSQMLSCLCAAEHSSMHDAHTSSAAVKLVNSAMRVHVS